jgi:hypothetical protein
LPEATEVGGWWLVVGGWWFVFEPSNLELTTNHRPPTKTAQICQLPPFEVKIRYWYDGEFSRVEFKSHREIKEIREKVCLSD